MGGSRKARHRKANVHTKVKVRLRTKKNKAPKPVVLPGTEERRVPVPSPLHTMSDRSCALRAGFLGAVQL